MAELAVKAHNCFVNGDDPDGHAEALNLALEGGIQPMDASAPIHIDEPIVVVTSGFIL